MLVGRSGLSPVMIGRSAELAQLEQALLDRARSTPTVALLSGEAGIGKTRLVQELVVRVPDGTFVLAGQAETDSFGRPLGLFLDAIDPQGGWEEQVLSEPAPHDVVRDAGAPADDRVRAAVELVRTLAQARPGLVIFEDLHWADSESVRIFEQLAEPTSGPLLLVGTYRPDALSRRHPASELLPRLGRRHSVTHLQLSRLSLGDVGTLLTSIKGRPPDYRLVEALHDRSGGNPFFLEELIDNMCDRFSFEDVEAAPLPWTVAEVVRAKLDELDPETHRVVAAAAVLGRRIRFDDLAAVTGTTEADLIRYLRTAMDSGLLVETEPDVFGFPHELAREAIEQSLLGRERRRLHEAALEVLAAGGHNHAALARHARGAGRYDDVIHHAREGAHEALGLGSSYQALQLAECGLNEAEDDADLRAVAARAAWLASLPSDAVTHGDRWLALARQAGDVVDESEALSLRMRVDYERGDLDSMRDHTQALVDIIDRLPTDEGRARAMATVAQYYMLRDKVTPTCEWADKALALAEMHDLDDVRLAAMVEKGSVLLHDPDRVMEGRALLEEAAKEAERLGEHILAVRAINNLLWHAREWSGSEEVRRLIEEMRRHGEAAGLRSQAAAYTAALAEQAITEGDLDAAIELLDEHRRGHPAEGDWHKGSWLTVFRAGLALEADDLDTAAELTELAKPPTQRNAPAVLGLDFHLACRRRDLDRARPLLAELLEVVAADGYADPAQVHDLLSAALPAGLTPDELRPLVNQAGLHVGHRLGPDHPVRRLLDAELAATEGRHADALAGYLAAIEGLPLPMDGHMGRYGSMHVGAARCLVTLDRLGEARDHVEIAAGYLARWRGWRVAELEALQRRLGMGDEPSGPEALTPREREVAALLAEGLTNSQLAERLFISPRTAAVHVSNILAKLGMSSRTEVATWAVRQQSA